MTEQQEAVGQLPPLPGRGASDEDRAHAVHARFRARAGAAPSIESYRKAYAAFGQPWPGDDVIRQRHEVADSAA